MNGCRDFHTEWSTWQGEISYDIAYMWNLKGNDTNELTYKTGRDSRLREWTYMVVKYLGLTCTHCYT